MGRQRLECDVRYAPRHDRKCGRSDSRALQLARRVSWDVDGKCSDFSPFSGSDFEDLDDLSVSCSTSRKSWQADFSSLFKRANVIEPPTYLRIRETTPPVILGRSSCSAEFSPRGFFGNSSDGSRTSAQDVQSQFTCSEERLMHCSCCSRREERPQRPLCTGAERELRVERYRVPPSLLGSPHMKGPMRFGHGFTAIERDEVSRRAAAYRDAKARFTVLPVVSLSQSGRFRNPFEGRICNTRLNPCHKGGWSRDCSSVLGDSIGSNRSSRIGTPRHSSSELSTPELNSTARLLARLEQARNETFNPRWTEGRSSRKEPRLVIQVKHC